MTQPSGADVAVGLERQVQRFDRQAVLRAGGNLQRPHAQAFQDLQQAKVGGRFDRNRVAGPRHRAQRQVQRFYAAMRDDDVVRRGVDAVCQCAAGEHGAQVRMALRRNRADQHLRRLAQSADHGLLKFFQRIGFGHCRGQGEVGADRMRFALGHEVRDPIVDAHVLRRAQCLADVRLVHGRDGVAAGLEHEVARAGPRFDQAVVFQLAACLQGRGQADVVGAHQRADRGHALGGRQHAGLDGAPVMVGQA
jgi:hypothetical protein